MNKIEAPTISTGTFRKTQEFKPTFRTSKHAHACACARSCARVLVRALPTHTDTSEVGENRRHSKGLMLQHTHRFRTKTSSKGDSSRPNTSSKKMSSQENTNIRPQKSTQRRSATDIHCIYGSHELHPSHDSLLSCGQLILKTTVSRSAAPHHASILTDPTTSERAEGAAR